MNEKKDSLIGFECVLPREDHAFQIMEWRNDPLALQMSYHSKPKVWETFYREFRNDYFSLADLPPLFILYKKERVGFVRFQLVEHPENLPRKCCEISVNISPDYRNKRIGTEALIEIKEWVANQGYDDIYAEVKEENTNSQKAFLKAGFKLVEKGIKKIEDLGEIFTIRKYVARLTEAKPDKTFIIAEAGSNWRMGTYTRDLSMAFVLVNIAKEAGADAIKFQTFRAESVYVPNAGKSEYLTQAGIVEDIHDIFTDLAMPYEMLEEIAKYCELQEIQFLSTPFSKQDFFIVDRFVNRHKIASYEINHLRLVELAAASGKPTSISTGAATEEEIAWAVETYRANGGKDLTLLQCTAHYPADPETLNLRVLPWLKHRFKVAVGLSDHSRHPTCAPVAAVAMGATIIEKHFTISNSLLGPDHVFALTPPELKEMVQAIRRTEQMLGSGVKNVQPSEEELRSFCQRGLQATKNISKGDILREGINVDILRAGIQPKGINPRYITEIEGKKATHAIPIGKGIERGDWI